MNDLLEDAKVWQKDWNRQLRADLDNHWLKTKCDQDNWLHNPTTKLKFTDGGEFKGRKEFNVQMKTVVECFIAKKICTGISEIIIQNPRSRSPLVKLKLKKELKVCNY